VRGKEGLRATSRALFCALAALGLWGYFPALLPLIEDDDPVAEPDSESHELPCLECPG
jgi:hypothetical protein